MAQPATKLALPDEPALAEHLPVVIIGGGQAGLAAGHHLKRRGVPFVILDAEARTGDTWRRRWDSLRLFTPRRYDALDGMRFPGPQSAFPTKDEMAEYLEAYAAKFELPIRHSVEVTRLERRNDRYVVSSRRQRYEADHVVVATSGYRVPRVPAYARQLGPSIRQIHSSEYKGPADLRDGPVLVVGAGNSGAEIALELARKGRTVLLSGRDVGEVPFRIESFVAKVLIVRLVLRVIFHRLLTVTTPIGRRVRAKSAGHGHALIRTKSRDLARAGVQRVARVRGVQGGLPLLEDGRALEIANVVWCTGFEPGFSWIDLPVFDGNGDPIHSSGVVGGEPGLYFLGLPFLHAMSSIMIHGVSRDAVRIADKIARRIR
jgi:putative flavoprotein involved in K+ transport